MKFPSEIRDLYKPVQPTVRKLAEFVSYREFLPDSNLQQFIYCYWQFKSTKPLPEEFNHIIVADGCIDIYFDLNDPKENYVMGFYKTFTEFQLDTTFNYIGVRFLPTMFPQFFGINAMELSNRNEHLQAVVPYLSGFISSRFDETNDHEELKVLLDKQFLDLISKKTFDYDNRLYRAIEIILKNVGMIDIERDLNTGISTRQLRRLFEFYVGDSAKTFSQVVRFQNVLKAGPSKFDHRQNNLFLDAGYYDQSHFIKEFKNFYGVNPGKAFGG